MPLYSLDDIRAKITALDAAIAKAEQAQSYEAGGQMRLARGDLAAMYKERDRWIKEYDKLDAQDQGGLVTKAQFERPL